MEYGSKNKLTWEMQKTIYNDDGEDDEGWDEFAAVRNYVDTMVQKRLRIRATKKKSEETMGAVEGSTVVDTGGVPAATKPMELWSLFLASMDKRRHSIFDSIEERQSTRY
ncbi:hypothetical protein GLAREA_11423 [Glarea lozoyensis ATCC 20868]|uniref:Uncharacterized protein n=1 Tax=Glarea lozoyensis (strain ATCC 20868 / MF5171) TaxID=1116229 RepID=S3CEE5_GLAL2|nr:uncharacterized protein GLAREA_11423 [Glarea lozoyensis ATCC 20868]EPE24842.1 hypothetical protein GLAREA_11423 [Glarea lozoyensis ATCC 20868]